MQTREIAINEIKIEMIDLGMVMNTAFENYYKDFIESKKIDIPNELRYQAGKFFDAFHNNSDYGKHDAFFSNFTPIWTILMELGDYRNTQKIWELALKMAYDWQQKTGIRIHKGTPYYFWGCSCILNDDIEKGFLLMHQGLVEDRESWQKMDPPTPNYWFVTLNFSQQKQFFIQKVKEIADFLDQRLNSYRISNGRNLIIQDFKAKFLENTVFKDIIFYFIYFIFRLNKFLKRTDSHIWENEFNSSLQARLLFDLCIIIDKLIEQHNSNPPQRGTHLLYYDNLLYLSNQCNLSLHNPIPPHSRIKLNELNVAFDGPHFGPSIQSILNDAFQFSDNSIFNSEIEENMAISYGFRNFGAHRIEDQPVIYLNFEAIADRILSVLFFVVETLL